MLINFLVIVIEIVVIEIVVIKFCNFIEVVVVGFQTLLSS